MPQTTFDLPGKDLLSLIPRPRRSAALAAPREDRLQLVARRQRGLLILNLLMLVFVGGACLAALIAIF